MPAGQAAEDCATRSPAELYKVISMFAGSEISTWKKTREPTQAGLGTTWAEVAAVTGVTVADPANGVGVRVEAGIGLALVLG